MHHRAWQIHQFLLHFLSNLNWTDFHYYYLSLVHISVSFRSRDLKSKNLGLNSAGPPFACVITHWCSSDSIRKSNREPFREAFSISAETTNEVHECQLGAEAISLFTMEKLTRTSTIVPQRWWLGLSEDRENGSWGRKYNVRNDSE